MAKKDNAKKVLKTTKESESFVEKLSKNNIDNTPPKNNKFAYIIGASLITFVAVGVGVPVGLAAQQISPTNPPRLNDNLITFTNSSGEKVTLTVGEFQNLFQLLNSETQSGNVQAIQNYFYQYLYQIEQNASVQYQEILNLTNPTNAVVNNIALKPLSRIIAEQRNTLEAREKNIIDNNPAGTARTTALLNLWSTSFNGAITSEQALQNSITNVIKANALRRFNVSQIASLTPSTSGQVTSDGFNSFSQYDISSRKLNQDVTLRNKIVVEPNGTLKFVDGTTILKNGENPFASFLEQRFFAMQNIRPNDSSFNQNSLSSQIALFTSNTFDISKKNPLDNIKNYFKSLNSQNIATFNINATPNTSDPLLPWTISANVLVKLFSYTMNPLTNKPSLNIDLIRNWKGINSSSTDLARRRLDSQLLNTVSDNGTKNNLGSRGIQDTLALLNAQDAGSILPLIENTFTKVEKDILTDIINNINSNIFAKAGIDINQITTFANSTNATQQIIQANTRISNILNGNSGVSGLNASEVTSLAGRALQQSFAVGNQGKLAESYLLPDGNIITLSSTGININSVKNFNSIDSYLSAIKDDLQLSANTTFATNQNITFNSDNIFATQNSIANINTANSDQRILFNFLSSNTEETVEFRKFLLLQNNTSLTTSSPTKFLDKDINNAIETLRSFINSAETNRSINVQTKINDYINSQINSNLKENYIFKNNQWIIQNNNSPLDAITTTINTITQHATNVITLNSLNGSDILFEGNLVNFTSIILEQNIYNINLDSNSNLNFYDPNLLDIKSVFVENNPNNLSNLFNLLIVANSRTNEIGKQKTQFELSLVNGSTLQRGEYKIVIEANIATNDFSNNINSTNKESSITKSFEFKVIIN
ncbi:HinT-interacting membrane complex protein P80 [[Mycoplasma] mobile]|uniref:M. homonis p80-related protein n=1 Tax=Mycoplasma mobile (strain ATCC 43663 / 163K / NCTC 11711) TaxID=267748 RepID=Q6KIJ9_MYCM1|nr:hypothetical protein [[Mycoplasma] mobile]AAT27577.1 M. homonis p80-related protein [Mycoplasma mobile 163K]